MSPFSSCMDLKRYYLVNFCLPLLANVRATKSVHKLQLVSLTKDVSYRRLIATICFGCSFVFLAEV